MQTRLPISKKTSGIYPKNFYFQQRFRVTLIKISLRTFRGDSTQKTKNGEYCSSKNVIRGIEALTQHSKILVQFATASNLIIWKYILTSLRIYHAVKSNKEKVGSETFCEI